MGRPAYRTLTGLACRTERAACLLAMLLGPLPSCGPAGAEADDATITVFAAASTADFLSAFARRYETDTGARVRCRFGASSTLAGEIEGGTRSDVYVSDHPPLMDWLDEAGLIETSTRFDLLANALVLVIPAEHSLGITVNFKMDHQFDFASVWTGKIAVPDPGHVPAGIYARQAMTALGWWADVQDRIVRVSDVRAAVRLVEQGGASYAIVYASDARTIEAVAAAAEFPPESHDPILYPVALCTGASDEARAFLEALAAPETAALRESFGFRVPAKSGDG